MRRVLVGAVLYGLLGCATPSSHAQPVAASVNDEVLVAVLSGPVGFHSIRDSDDFEPARGGPIGAFASYGWWSNDRVRLGGESLYIRQLAVREDQHDFIFSGSAAYGRHGGHLGLTLEASVGFALVRVFDSDADRYCTAAGPTIAGGLRLFIGIRPWIGIGVLGRLRLAYPIVSACAFLAGGGAELGIGPALRF